MDLSLKDTGFELSSSHTLTHTRPPPHTRTHYFYLSVLFRSISKGVQGHVLRYLASLTGTQLRTFETGKRVRPLNGPVGPHRSCCPWRSQEPINRPHWSSPPIATLLTFPHSGVPTALAYHCCPYLILAPLDRHYGPHLPLLPLPHPGTP